MGVEREKRLNPFLMQESLCRSLSKQTKLYGRERERGEWGREREERERERERVRERERERKNGFLHRMTQTSPPPDSVVCIYI